MTGTAVGSEKTRPTGPGRPAEQTGRPGAPERWQDVRSAISGLINRAAGLLRRARWRWLSSLRIRVVSTTLVVSAVVVSMLGFFLMQQITANFLRKAESEAVTQGNNGLGFADSLPGASQAPQASTEESFMSSVVYNLQASGQNPDQYGVAVLPPLSIASTAYVGSIGPDLPVNVKHYLPPNIVSQVASGSLKWPLSFARMPFPAAGDSETTGLLYAARLTNGYQLYYFFPLTQVQTELGQVLRTLVLVGFALVFLLAGIAWLLTRWVVVPVARAAHGAQLLSTGNLGERLTVRGNDEVAALARSFNDMAASLQEKMSELEDLSHVQRQFVSDVSHELRTPLTTIRMAADLLYETREQLEPQANRSAELLQSQLGRFESLLVDLLEISRYDANAATLDAELVDVCDIVRNSADVAQQLAERRGSRIEFRLPADPCVAEIDRRRVERILRNLLVNAVEHGEGREVVVSSAADGGAVAIAVRDHGVGLWPGEEHLVFDRFWRADPARARTTGGTGLGLAIALEDARLHGGWLEAWGKPGQGSVFRLTLPRTAGTELAGSPLPLRPDLAEATSSGASEDRP
jgi:two-component system sensor histidine kinase MtrB